MRYAKSMPPARRHATPDNNAAIGGYFLTLMLGYAYLSGFLQAFPRSAAHDVAAALAITVCWRLWFAWDALGRFPRLRRANSSALVLSAFSLVIALFGLAYCLIFTA